MSEGNETATAAAPARRKRATRIGVVVSSSMTKSVVVKVERLVMHDLYKRSMRRSTKYMAHDEKAVCKPGDRVLIEECRPLSKRKRWVVKQVLGHTLVPLAPEAPTAETPAETPAAE